MERKFYLGNYGEMLWTRVKGREVRKDLIILLDGSFPGDSIVIDLNKVEIFDISFANELFGKTIIELPKSYPGRFLVIENLGEYPRENLEKALESLNLVLIERNGETLSLIGKVHPSDYDTFMCIANANKPITSVELKDILKINVTAMNERLKKLTELGLIHRKNGVSTSGREQYLYSVFK